MTKNVVDARLRSSSVEDRVGAPLPEALGDADDPEQPEDPQRGRRREQVRPAVVVDEVPALVARGQEPEQEVHEERDREHEVHDERDLPDRAEVRDRADRREEDDHEVHDREDREQQDEQLVAAALHVLGGAVDLRRRVAVPGSPTRSCAALELGLAHRLAIVGTGPVRSHRAT